MSGIGEYPRIKSSSQKTQQFLPFYLLLFFNRDFLKRKLDEYEMLKMEIEELKRDIEVE